MDYKNISEKSDGYCCGGMNCCLDKDYDERDPKCQECQKDSQDSIEQAQRGIWDDFCDIVDFMSNGGKYNPAW